MTERIVISVEQGDLNNADLFVFTDNLVFECVFYKGTSKSPLLFELFLRLHKVQMKGDLILKVVHIAGTRMIEAVIESLPRGINMGEAIRGLEPL